MIFCVSSFLGKRKKKKGLHAVFATTGMGTGGQGAARPPGSNPHLACFTALELTQRTKPKTGNQIPPALSEALAKSPAHKGHCLQNCKVPDSTTNILSWLDPAQSPRCLALPRLPGWSLWVCWGTRPPWSGGCGHRPSWAPCWAPQHMLHVPGNGPW